MKVKYIIVLYLMALILMVIGAQFKISHWPGGTLLIMIANTIKIIAIVFAIVKVLTMDKFKDFLNN